MPVNEQSSSSDGLHIGIIVVHGVADAEQGANLNVLVNAISATHKAFERDNHDEVYRLPEPEPLPREPSDRPVIVHRARINQRQKVSFAEVYWADTTRVSTAKFAALIAAFRVIFEAHYFIDAMLEKNPGKCSLCWIQARLLYGITGLIRGPISGLNIALLVLAAIYIYGQSILQLADIDLRCSVTASRADPACVVVPLDLSVLLTMCALAAYLIRAFIRSRNREDVATLEVLVWTIPCVIIGGSLLAAVMFSDHFYGTRILATLTAQNYALAVFIPMVGLWCLLGGLIIAATAVTIGISWRTKATRTRRASWHALALVMLQAYLWSVLIAIPSIPLMAWGKLVGVLPPKIQLLTFGFAFNYFGVLIIAGVALAVVAARSRAERSLGESSASQERLSEVAQGMPRLIINRSIVTAIVVTGVLTTFIRLVLEFHSDWMNSIAAHLPLSLFLTLLVTAIALALYSVLDTKPFVNFIHIARDLTDHQYKPSLSRIYRFLYPGWKSRPEYPRRQRLLSRLKTTVELLGDCNAFVFVAHSQGSIIVYEHLRTLRDTPKCKPAVVTFGSPLTHLYEQYFHDYANVEQVLERLRDCLTSWTNLHRIDDPIGSAIDGRRDLVTNIAMGLGGHTNYWPEPAVAQAITDSMSRLCNERASDRPSSGQD